MDEETVQFKVAHNRKYSTDHLWYQEKDDRLMIGVSEFLKFEIIKMDTQKQHFFVLEYDCQRGC